MNITEIHMVVSELNNEFYREVIEHGTLFKFFKEYGYPFSYSSNGEEFLIEFLNLPIWYSMDEDRDFIEDLNEYELLKTHLIKKTKIILSNLSKLYNLLYGTTYE
jgi:hypothetical protein